MDVAASVAGFVGLAALTAQSTVKIIDFVKDVKNLPDKLQQYLQWLEQLVKVLNQLPKIFAKAEQCGVAIDLNILQSCLESCSKAVERLAKYLESRMQSLRDMKQLSGYIRRLKGVLASKDVEGQMEDIRRKQISLNLCLTSIIP